MPSLAGVAEQPERTANLGRVSADLSRFDTRRSVKDAFRTGAITRTDVRTRTKAIPAPRITLFTLLAFVTIVALLISMIYNYMQLNEITVKSSELKSKLAVLSNDQRRLSSNLDTRLNLKAVEERALEMGMIKPEQDQVFYVSLSGGDKAVVISEGGSDQDIFAEGAGNSLLADSANK